MLQKFQIKKNTSKWNMSKCWSMIIGYGYAMVKIINEQSNTAQEDNMTYSKNKHSEGN